jgi:hypothetical protein
MLAAIAGLRPGTAAAAEVSAPVPASGSAAIGDGTKSGFTRFVIVIGLVAAIMWATWTVIRQMIVAAQVPDWVRIACNMSLKDRFGGSPEACIQAYRDEARR